MAIYKSDIVDINLETGSIHRSFLKHAIGTADQAADRFGIRAFRDGAPVDLSGASCYGYFRNSHGTNIALTSNGTVSGNLAYVTLPQACYNYEGNFTLAIKLLVSGVTSTVRIIDGVVDNTNTGSAVAPTSAVPTYSEILEQYDAMVAATAVANGAIATTFNAATVYPAGSYVINDGALYRITADHAANVTWANTSKVATNFGAEVTALKSAFNDSVLSATNTIMPSFKRTIVKNDLIKGTYSENGEFSVKNKRLRTIGLIPVYAMDTITITFNTTITGVTLAVFDKNMQNLSENNIAANTQYRVKSDGYVILMFRKEADTQIDYSDYDAEVVFESKSSKWAENVFEIAEYLQDEISPILDLSTITWTIGSISSYTGIQIESTNRLRSSNILAKRGTRISVSSNNYKFAVYLYTSVQNYSNTYIYGKDLEINIDEYVVPMDCYIRIVLAKTDDSTLTDDSIKSELRATIYNFITEKIQLTTPLMRQYYETGENTFDKDTNVSISTSNYFCSGVVDCNPGDQFILSGVGGSSGRLYAFYDENGGFISRENTVTRRKNMLLTAPANAKTLVVNSQNEEAELLKVVPYKDIDKTNNQGEKILVNGTIMNASFAGTSTSTPHLHYENGCRTYGFHVKEGAKYTVRIKNGTSVRLGLVHDEIEIKASDKTGTTDTDIELQGFVQFDTNPFTFIQHGFKTAFVYGSSNTATNDVEFIVIEENNDRKWADEVSKKTALQTVNIRNANFIGSPEFYVSEPTAESATYLDSKTVSELYALYDSMCAQYPHMIKRATDIGEDESETYEIREYVMTFTDPLVTNGEVSLSGDIDLETITNLWKPSMRNNILAITSGMHGNEKAPAWGMALAVEEILSSNKPFAQFIKSNFEVHIIPCVNPWGFDHNVRRNSNDVDINRDFIDYTQAETQAFRDWMIGIASRCAAYIDVHGTSGYYAYFEAAGDDPYYEGYCNTCMRFTSAILHNWMSFYNSFGLSKYPYCFMVRSTYQGTQRTLKNKLGILGHTVETPQDFTVGSGWKNDLRSCKLTKDLLINAMQVYGKWGSRIKNQEKNPFDLT